MVHHNISTLVIFSYILAFSHSVLAGVLGDHEMLSFLEIIWLPNNVHTADINIHAIKPDRCVTLICPVEGVFNHLWNVCSFAQQRFPTWQRTESTLTVVRKLSSFS